MKLLPSEKCGLYRTKQVTDFAMIEDPEGRSDAFSQIRFFHPHRVEFKATFTRKPLDDISIRFVRG